MNFRSCWPPFLITLVAVLFSSGYCRADIPGARKSHDSLIVALQAAPNDTTRMAILHGIFDNFDPRDSARLPYITQYAAVASRSGDKKYLIRSCSMYADFAINAGRDLKSGISWYQRADSIARDLNDTKAQAHIKSQMAATYESLLNHSKAIEYFLASMELNPDQDKVKSIWGDMGTVYFNIGDYPKAADCYEKAYNIQNEQLSANKNNSPDDSLTLMGLLISLADVDVSMSQYDKAYGLYQTTAQLNRHISNNLVDLWINMGMGKCFQHRNERARALEYYQVALRDSRLVKDLEMESDISARIGYIYLESGEIATALEFADMALTTTYYNENSASRAGANLLMGKIYAARRQFPLAVTSVKKSITIFNRMGKTDEESNAWHELSSVYDKMNDPAAAFDAYKHFIALRDSVFSIEKARQVAITEMQGVVYRRQVHDSTQQARKDADMNLHLQRQRWFTAGGLVALAMVLLISFFIYRNYSQEKKANVALNAEKQVSESLLLNILPAGVATELKNNGKVQARLYDNVTVLMTDFVNFTTAGARMQPDELVAELHACFEAFDNIISKYRIEKIKTVGDAYVAVSGLPNANPRHAADIVNAALEIMDFMSRRRIAKGTGSFGIRVGVNSGKLIAGVVGVKKFAYDIWGDTVNTAARMEQNSEPGEINISESTYQLIKDEIPCRYRGEIEAKGKGMLSMHYVERIARPAM